MATAQDVYKQVLRDLVAPALRHIGFRGSGSNFELPSPSHWALLGFQKSQWSDSDSVTFTANATAVPRDAWASIFAEYPQLGDHPGANWSPAPIFGDLAGRGYWHSRVGMLMPGSADVWWTLSADGAAASRVGQEVIDAIREYALPAIHARTR